MSSSLVGIAHPICLASCIRAQHGNSACNSTSLTIDPFKSSFCRSLHRRTAPDLTPTHASNPTSKQFSPCAAAAFLPSVKHGMQNVMMHNFGSEKHPNNGALNSDIVNCVVLQIELITMKY